MQVLRDISKKKQIIFNKSVLILMFSYNGFLIVSSKIWISLYKRKSIGNYFTKSHIEASNENEE